MRKTFVTLGSLFVLASGTGLCAAANGDSLVIYFPSHSQYPRGYQVLPVGLSRDPAVVFGRPAARAARRLRFVAGNTQLAFRGHTVVVVAMGRFQSPSEAARFGAPFGASVVENRRGRRRALARFGSGGARYVSGRCPTCGAHAPDLGELFFVRGRVFVAVGVQPSDLSLARSLSTIIDRKLRNAHAGRREQRVLR
jgi:hypothetical protein